MQNETAYVELNDKLDLCSPAMRAIYDEVYREIARDQRKEDAE